MLSEYLSKMSGDYSIAFAAFPEERYLKISVSKDGLTYIQCLDFNVLTEEFYIVRAIQHAIEALEEGAI